MPPLPGLLTMPTVLLNAALSAVRGRGLTVRGPDTVAVVSPMYNEERGAARALTSVFEQTSAPDQLVISINGGRDATREVVSALLVGRGYRREPLGTLLGSDAELERWSRAEGGLEVTLAAFPHRSAKSDSLNRLVEAVVRCDRVLVIDGDTVLERRFLEVMRDSFYRLVEGPDGFVLEDTALQSGAVMSFAPPGSGPAQRLISLGRRAEYAFAGVIRRGQTATFGASAVFSRSRLYTVVGCGFVARRELFPIPDDTMTEDHDFTLAVQTQPVAERNIGVQAFEVRGFRAVLDGREISLPRLIGGDRTVLYRQVGDARFVGEALMLTEDPPHLNGLFRQVERWNGGAIENVLKRLQAPGRGARSPNVSFALWTSQLEHLLGLLLLALIPVLVAVNLGNPTAGMSWSTLLRWLGFDLAVGALLTGYGFWLYLRAARRRRWPAALRTVAAVAVTLLPFMLLKYLNPLAYLAGAVQVLPQRLGRRAPLAGGVTWERPAAGSPARTPLLVRWLALAMAIVVLSAAQVSSQVAPVNREAWSLVTAKPRIEMALYESLPLAKPLPQRPEPEELGLSRYCDPTFVGAPAAEPRLLAAGAPPYVPLTRWGLLTLARLAPIAPYLEEAATAYDVPPRLFLQVLLNESYLDPLAVGPTGDKGLSQMTSDALTMLRALSNRRGSRLHNPRLIPEDFHIFDPDFSLCAGAAKLAWALEQPAGHDPAVAYALYINPVRGAARGQVSPRHAAAVAAMLHLETIAEQLQAVYAAASTDLLSPAEQALVGISREVAAGEIDLETAYRSSLELVATLEINDADVYRRVLDELFAPADYREVEVAFRR